MAVIISTFALIGVSLILVKGIVASGAGTRQAGSQQDAQLALRGIARVARESKNYVVNTPNDVTFFAPPQVVDSLTHGGGAGAFCLGWQIRSVGQILELSFVGAGCPISPPPWIDGNRSKVAQFTVTGVSAQIVRIHLDVTHQLGANDPRQEMETLNTEIYLRNA